MGSAQCDSTELFPNIQDGGKNLDCGDLSCRSSPQSLGSEFYEGMFDELQDKTTQAAEKLRRVFYGCRGCPMSRGFRDVGERLFRAIAPVFVQSPNSCQAL